MMAGPWEKYSAPASAAAPAEQGPWANYGSGADQKAPPPAAAAPITLTTTDRKGKKVSFEAPADADDETVRKLAAKALKDPRYLRSEVQRADGKPANVEAAPDDNSALSGFLAGAVKPLDKAAEWIGNTGVGRAIDKFGTAIGLPSTADASAEHDEWRRNNTRTGYQTLGNIAGTLPLAAVPGGTSALGLAAQGAASGALLTDHHDLIGTAKDAGIGALSSVVGGKALQSLGGLAKGVTDKGAKMLHQAGVPLTLGQIGRAANNLPGKIVSGIEDRVSGLPIIGDVINSAKDRGITALNTALGNRILANVGEKVAKGTEPGHAMIDAVQSKLSSRYSKLVPNLKGVIDQETAEGFTAARDLADQASRGPQLAKVVERVFGKRLDDPQIEGATLSGQKLKDAESELTRLYSKYKNAQGDEGLYGEAINMVRQTLRDTVMRSNPANATELAGLNKAWAQLKTLRDAVRAGSDRSKATGLVSPGAALRVTARQGYRDPLLESATQILPDRVPDSGTAGRVALSVLAGTGAAGAVGLDPREHPIAAGTLAGLAALSTRPGQAAIVKAAFGSRPAAVRALAVPLNKLSRYAPQLVTPVAVGVDQ